MKTFFMQWVINPGIAFLFGFFVSAILVGLIDTILLNTTSMRPNLLEQLVTPGAYILGYVSAAIALNIDRFHRPDAEDRFIK